MNKQKTPPLEECPVETAEDKKIKKIVDKHLDNVNEVVLKVLADCLTADLNFYDVSYIPRRIIQVVEETTPSMDFKSKELEASLKGYFINKAREIKDKVTIDVYDSKTREAKCEPIVHDAIAMILSSDFMEKDKEWIESYLEETVRMFVITLVKHLFEATFSRLDFSVEQSFTQAQNKLFGVAKSQLPLKALDKILKRK